MELRVTGLACARGGLAVLAGLDMVVAPGAALVLRGPNGAGKTTLLRTLAGLQPPLAGQVHLPAAGAVYAGHLDGAKAVMSVAENLSFWAQVMGAPGIGPALDAFALRPLSDRPAQSLSAGQKRRLGLARLVLAGPGTVWLCDEPTVSLDAASVALFAAAVTAHLGQGGMAVIATHTDLGLPQAAILDLTSFRARHQPDVLLAAIE
jgi:heme exporter protein A